MSEACASSGAKPEQTTKAPDNRGLCREVADECLLQRGRDRAEVAGQLGADALNCGDDRNRDAGGNEAVFDGGSAGLVLHKTRNEILHKITPVYTWLIELMFGLAGVLSTVT